MALDTQAIHALPETGSTALAPVSSDWPRWLQPGYDEAGFLELADVFGASNLVATHFGPMPAIEEAASQFARLCDAAAEHGLTVSLEYPAMATIADVGTAWQVVSGANRRNGGILHDNWHHDRSPATDAQLAQVPAEKFFSVQLSDASSTRVGPPIEDAKYRRLIGQGDLDVVETLRALVARGVRCPIGTEIFFSFDERPPLVRIQEFYDNLRDTFVAAGLDPAGSRAKPTRAAWRRNGRRTRSTCGLPEPPAENVATSVGGPG